ncbi:molybdopterin synthase sulfur carrier subunit [Thermosediminibacter litoriperuensis]|uniref:Molybdopterin synthase sulfur carrier subunit n=2 Tax=Thermosediminibacter litoriperuensis TaxID=291989 RepID=A0A5S5AF80_9FIRM|nr:molybdopterin synthase sulfur carrier subunit [Thermosediminibacter litoriperuensis]
MKVKLFAYLRDYTGVKEIEVGHCRTVRQLLKELCGIFGKKFAREVFDGENLSGRVIVLVNGMNILHLENLDTELKEDDEISLFPVVAGGR